MMSDFEHDCDEFDIDWNITLLLFITFDVAWWFTLDIIRWMKGKQKHDELSGIERCSPLSWQTW
jgi:hypothetical protein